MDKEYIRENYDNILVKINFLERGERKNVNIW
jgi:hypothetical protein